MQAGFSVKMKGSDKRSKERAMERSKEEMGVDPYVHQSKLNYGGDGTLVGII